MKVAMEEVARKLTLWHTRTFRPIMTHEDLEPIMAAVGFVPLPMAAPAAPGHVVWREYVFRAAPEVNPGGCLPRPRLPYPRIDGLHLWAYKIFFEALEFHLGEHEVPELFHVRSMSLTRAQDRVFDKAYRPMRECNMDDEGIFVYRDGTLDHITKIACSNSSHNNNDSRSEAWSKSSNSSIYLVPLEDLFPVRDTVSLD